MIVSPTLMRIFWEISNSKKVTIMTNINRKLPYGGKVVTLTIWFSNERNEEKGLLIQFYKKKDVIGRIYDVLLIDEDGDGKAIFLTPVEQGILRIFLNRLFKIMGLKENQIIIIKNETI